MPYTEQTWSDGPSGGTPITAARLQHIEDGLAVAEATAESAQAATGTTSATPRLGIIRVASSEATAAVRAQCDYVCTGTNDQTVINQALIAATRPGDGLGGVGAICVELVGPNFYIGNNNTGCILLPPSVWLKGSGPGTFIQPMHSSYTGIGAIQLYSSNTDHTHLSDLTIAKPNDVLANVDGIRYDMTASGNAYQLKTGGDPYHEINNVRVVQVAGYGITANGVSGGARETHVHNAHVWNSNLTSFYWQGTSDSKFTACTANPGAGGPGFQLSGGNIKLVNSKCYYADGSTDGFLVSGSRTELTGCSAQDNGRYGYNVTSGDVTIVGCVADSNARVDATGGGFLISGSGTFTGLSAFDRGQTPASPQLQGIIFQGSPQVYLSARVRVPSGTAHVVGTPGANSFVRVVRDGTTAYTFG